MSAVDVVAKYFFFHSLDEQISFAASLKTVGDLRARGRMGDAFRPEWIRTLVKGRASLKGLRGRPWPDFSRQPGFLLPDDFDLVAWSHFLSTADASEVDAVLFSKILGFTDEEIAAALDVTLGTVRYRVGRGLRHLGGYLES